MEYVSYTLGISQEVQKEYYIKDWKESLGFRLDINMEKIRKRLVRD
jgi:hypothetical protein